MHGKLKSQEENLPMTSHQFSLLNLKIIKSKNSNHLANAEIPISLRSPESARLNEFWLSGVLERVQITSQENENNS